MKLIISAELFISEDEFIDLCKHVADAHISSQLLYPKKKTSILAKFIRGLLSPDQNKNLHAFLHEIYSNKTVGISYYLMIFFFLFLKKNSLIFPKNNIHDLVIIWPDSFSEHISKYLSVDMELCEKVLHVNYSKDIHSPVAREFFNDAYQRYLLFHKATLISFGETLSSSMNAADYTSKFYLNRVLPHIQDYKISEATADQLLNIECSLLLKTELKQSTLSSEKGLLYFIEDSKKHLETVLDENKFIQGISTNSDKHFDSELITISNQFAQIFDSIEPTFPTEGYLLNLPEALDIRLQVLLQNFRMNNLKTNYVYLRYGTEFIKRNLISYLRYSIKSPFSEVYIDSKGDFTIPDGKYLIVDGLNKIKTPKKQLELWESLTNSRKDDRKVIFLDLMDPTSALIKLEASCKWVFNHAMITNNLSKVFHSLLPEETQQLTTDADLRQAIKDNKFADLIKVDDKEIDLEKVNEAITNINSVTKFDYKDATAWYEFRKEYGVLIEDISNNDILHEQVQNTVTIGFTKEGKNVKISYSEKELEPISYGKPIVYFFLIYKYWEDHEKEGIQIEQLMSIVNYYFNSTVLIGRRLIDHNYTDESDKRNLDMALKYDEVVNSYPEEIKDLIRNQTEVYKKKVLIGDKKIYKYFIRFKESDPENRRINYKVTIKGFEVIMDLFQDAYRDFMIARLNI